MLKRLQRAWPPVLAGLVIALVIVVSAVGIAVIQGQSRARLLAAFGLRGSTSATFVSTFLAEQADREKEAAQRLLSGPRVSSARFQAIVAAFGSSAGVLLDSAGRVLAIAPADPALLGKPIATHYAHLMAAERGRVAVSNVVPSAAKGTPVAAVAVPFASRNARRVFSAAYTASDSTLGAFVDHAISYPQHEVYLVDSLGDLVAASPRTRVRSLDEVDPALARAVGRSSRGSVAGARVPSTFTVAAVSGTPWRVVIAVPNSRLYASVNGWTTLIPWLVLALLSVLGVLLVVLFARLNAMSRRMAHSARTDSLTGLFNRRALSEHLSRATAQARRSGESLSVLMIDLDRFKETNDRFGHLAGDRVLCTVADCMRQVLRRNDIYGRWGGDEFLVVMPSGSERDARAVAQRLRVVAGIVELDEIGLRDGVQMSVGVATAVHTTPEEIVHSADLALYQAKSRPAQTSQSLA